jgi:hypothetical protein
LTEGSEGTKRIQIDCVLKKPIDNFKTNPNSPNQVMSGNPNGDNRETPGYINNTKEGVGKSGDSNPDRHFYRPASGSPSRQRAMKCSRCYDYNKGFAWKDVMERLAVETE